MRDDPRLRTVKLVHTAAWAFFAFCVVLIPVAASKRRFAFASLPIGVVAIESVEPAAASPQLI